MAKTYFHDDGTPSPVPTSKADAKRYRTKMYDCGEMCPNCKTILKIGDSFHTSHTTRKYTLNDECPQCARLMAIEFYNFAIGVSKFGDKNVPEYVEGEFEDIADGTPYLKYKDDSGVKALSRRMKSEFLKSYSLLGNEVPPINAAGANQSKFKLWVRPDACVKAGHLGIRTTTGECYFCEEERKKPSPRQAAIRNGERWYTPDVACPRCNTKSLKRVDNGQCKGCTGNTTPTDDKRETPDSIMMRESPDMMIDRTTARSLDFKVYRTGKSCKQGHTGFRYVSTGNCIKCLRGEK